MGLPKYILNLDEFSKLYEALSIDLKETDLGTLEKLLKDNLEAILELLKIIAGKKGYGCMDMSRHIPAIVNKFVTAKKFDRDILITGLTFSQSAWKEEDTLSLKAGDSLIIDEMHTKELGQEKRFYMAFPVEAGEEIKVIYNNKSGNSKMFFCDLDYIKLEKEKTENGEGI